MMIGRSTPNRASGVKRLRFQALPPPRSAVASERAREDIAIGLHEACIAYNRDVRPHYYDSAPWDELTEEHRDSHRKEATRILPVVDRYAQEREAAARRETWKTALELVDAYRDCFTSEAFIEAMRAAAVAALPGPP